jgi:hypothetical protein
MIKSSAHSFQTGGGMKTEFEFSRKNLSRREALLERGFGILPGLTSWAILIGLAVFSFLKPIEAACVMIAVYFYWLLRILYMTIFLLFSYLRLSIEQGVDWLERIQGVDRLDSYLEELKQPQSNLSLKKRISRWFHKGKLETLQKSGSLPPKSGEVYQLVIIAVTREGQEVVEPGIESLRQQSFPLKRMAVVIALEERAEEAIKQGMQDIKAKYQSLFMDFLISVHPKSIPGEASVKGANVTHAAKEAVRYFEGRKIPFEQIIVSCFDADTVVSRDYFACLTYHFMTYPDRNRASFQPIPVYHNNIWEAPAFSRVLDIGSSFFQLIEATNHDQLVTFSSHSMSFKALVDVNYWPVDMISDDSAIFWKSLIHFDGNYRVIPLYATLSMDVVSGINWWHTIVSVYRQKRRWAWGVENFPIVMRGFLANSRISLCKKIQFGFKLFEENIAWATWAFLLTLIGWLPALFASQRFSDTVLYYSAPRIAAIIFNLASLALITTIVLSFCLLPKTETKNALFKKIGLAFEWLLVPVIVVFLSAFPALDAQTRLMFGRYMEFWVTEKTRKHQ